MDRQTGTLGREFQHNEQLDKERMDLWEKGDEIFAEVVKSFGEAKREAIKKFDKHNKVVQSLLDKHAGYFKSKRRRYIGFWAYGGGLQDSEGISIKKSKYVLFAILAGTILFQGMAFAQIPEETAVKAIIGEAEGEGFTGMLAVAGALRNRGSLKGVYGLHSRRVRQHLYSQSTYNMAKRAWDLSNNLDVTNGATGWGNRKDLDKFCSENWWAKCTVTARIGRQWFYKEVK